jgi:hypothetical protein
VASIPAELNEREMIELVTKHRVPLLSTPNAFPVPCAQRSGRRAKERDSRGAWRFAADVEKHDRRFVSDTGRREHVVPVAGALRCTQYNFLVRSGMKRVTRRSACEGAVDTTSTPCIGG